MVIENDVHRISEVDEKIIFINMLLMCSYFLFLV